MRTFFLILLSVPAVVSRPSRAQSGRLCSVSGKVTFTTSDKSLSVTDLVVYVQHKPRTVKLAEGREHEMAQIDETFVPRLLVVQKNDSVSFPNRDRKDHSVFTKDLSVVNIPASNKVKPESQAFSKEGMYRIQCNIHDRMKAWVVVVPVRELAAQVQEDGSWQIDGLPEGRHELKVKEPNGGDVEFTATACDNDTVNVSVTGKPARRLTHIDGTPYPEYQ